jgi:hypothetical protein
MTRRPVRRALFSLVFASAMPLVLMGCPKKPPPAQEDAAPPPPASTPVLNLAALDDDAGADAADANEAGKHWTGPGINPNQAKLRQCCAAIAAQAKQLGTSPEGFQLNAIAGQCYAFANQIGPAGNAPEFAQVRALLSGKTLPGSCAGM